MFVSADTFLSRLQKRNVVSPRKVDNWSWLRWPAILPAVLLGFLAAEYLVDTFSPNEFGLWTILIRSIAGSVVPIIVGYLLAPSHRVFVVVVLATGLSLLGLTTLDHYAVGVPRLVVPWIMVWCAAEGGDRETAERSDLARHHCRR